jgi:DNA invertase Pin-like site-specific DNA recombinase
VRKGDVLMVTRIDRLARSIGDLQDIVRAVKAKGAALKATEQPIDTSTAAGKCLAHNPRAQAEQPFARLRQQAAIRA